MQFRMQVVVTVSADPALLSCSSSVLGSTYGVLQLFSSTVVVSIDSEKRLQVFACLRQDPHTLVLRDGRIPFPPPAFLGNNNHNLFKVGCACTMQPVSCTSYLRHRHDDFIFKTKIRTGSYRNLTFFSFFFSVKTILTSTVSVAGFSASVHLFVATGSSLNWFNCAGVMRQIKADKEPSVGSRVQAGRILMNERKVM